jgi:hypothetical protein
MKNIKRTYWLLASVFLLLTIIVFLLCQKSVLKADNSSVFLSGFAIVISIIAMGLSDKKKIKFNGKITAKKDKRNNKVKFVISNLDKDSVLDFIYKVRFPQSMSFYGDKNIHARNFISGVSKQIVDDSWGFLPSFDEGENYIEFYLSIPFENWNKDNIWVSISGSNIAPTVYTLKFENKEKLSHSEEITFELRNK